MLFTGKIATTSGMRGALSGGVFAELPLVVITTARGVTPASRPGGWAIGYGHQWSSPATELAEKERVQ